MRCRSNGGTIFTPAYRPMGKHHSKESISARMLRIGSVGATDNYIIQFTFFLKNIPRNELHKKTKHIQCFFCRVHTSIYFLILFPSYKLHIIKLKCLIISDTIHSNPKIFVPSNHRFLSASINLFILFFRGSKFYLF